MNSEQNVSSNFFYEFQYGNVGAAVFIIAYIGFYGLGIICVFVQQLKETQRHQFELPAYFLKTLWDVPNKNRLYEELSDIDRLKRIFRGYFADHHGLTTLNNNEIQMIVEERAQVCAAKYREKIRRLHLSHTDYYLDTIQRVSDEENSAIELNDRTKRFISPDEDPMSNVSNELDQKVFSVSVV